MEWSWLWHQFLCGDSSAIQSIFSIANFVITLAGIIYVGRTFHQQKQINKEQQRLNYFALEKERRSIRPQFTYSTGSSKKFPYGPVITFRVENSQAYNLKFTFLNGGPIEFARVEPAYFEILRVGRSRDFDFTKNLILKTDVALKINFEDEDGREYLQELRWGEIDNLYLSHPILLYSPL